MGTKRGIYSLRGNREDKPVHPENTRSAKSFVQPGGQKILVQH